MTCDARSIFLAFAGVFVGAAAVIVAFVSADIVAAFEALGMLAYCCREFLLVAATDVA
ncbi:MAG: hypothetical protein M3R53_03300 [Candidatus Eremiobacteraeota bacterium]|nr:hypothetical protein [Candidatus Eremiobacteraeota bacterium]